MLSSLLCLSLIHAQVPPPRDETAIITRLRTEERSIVARESADLRRIAGRLEAGRQPEAAAAVLAQIAPAPAPNGPIRFVPLPEVVPAGDVAGGNAEVKAVREAAAKALFGLAIDAAAPGSDRFDVADGLLRAVLAREPAHREARRLMGYVAHNGGWATPHAAQNLKDGLVLDSKFGWVPADWVQHLRRGELPGPIPRNGRPIPWLPALEADALRDTIDRGWTIKTEHFEIRTDVPLAEAILFGRRLEALHDAFFSLFADVLGDSLPLARRFRDPKLWASAKGGYRYSVWYFATKQEYVEMLTPIEGPTIAKSLGDYVPPKKGKTRGGRSYFFRDTGGQIDIIATLFHEASHQLLFESGVRSAQEQNSGNYWVWEGLGTYFETFSPQEDGSYLVGGLVGPRIAKARADLIDGGLFIPIGEFLRMDKEQFNDDAGVYRNYAEAMALTVFLMHADGGRYREAFLDYVADAYRGRLGRGSVGRSLLNRLGVPAKALDEQFLKFLDEGTRGAESPRKDRP